MSNPSILSNMIVISVNDAAIDTELTDLEKYGTDRELDSVKFIADQKPDTFELKKLPFAQLHIIKSSFKSPVEKAIQGFGVAVVRVTLSDGTVIDAPAELAKNAGKADIKEYVSEQMEFIDKVNDAVGYDVITEIGDVALQFSGMTNRQKKVFYNTLGMVRSR